MAKIDRELVAGAAGAGAEAGTVSAMVARKREAFATLQDAVVRGC